MMLDQRPEEILHRTALGIESSEYGKLFLIGGANIGFLRGNKAGVDNETVFDVIDAQLGGFAKTVSSRDDR